MSGRLLLCGGKSSEESYDAKRFQTAMHAMPFENSMKFLPNIAKK